MFNNKSVIGHHITSDVSKSQDWYGRWPEIDSDGIIVDVHDGDCIPYNAILVDWDNGIVEVDGDTGFEAIMLK